MSFFKSISEFFQNLFLKSSPEFQAKSEVKKIEASLKSYQPALYKNGCAQPNIGEAFRVLYENTKVIDSVLSTTISTSDYMRNNRFLDALIETGFQGEMKQIIESISYEKRKEEVALSIKRSKTFEEHRKRLDSVIKAVNTPDFKKIEGIINKLYKLIDICHFNYMDVLHLFDSNFVSSRGSVSAGFHEVPLEQLEKAFLDLYYCSYGLEITTSVARAIVALAEIKRYGKPNDKEELAIMNALKKISSILRKILSTSILHKCIQVIKNDPNYAIQAGINQRKILEEYCDRLKKNFDSDELRIRTELNDEHIELASKKFLSGKQIITVEGYNSETNKILQSAGVDLFSWIMPIQLLKSFITYYYDDAISTLLNTVVVEGFFNNPVFKTDFAATVYSCTQCKTVISEFEADFEKGNCFDMALIKNYARDGHINPDLLKKLSQMVETANNRVFGIIKDNIKYFTQLFTNVGSLLSDSKKTTSGDVTNIKLLFSSIRNKDSVEQLENQMPQWDIFLDIMKNYVIMSDTEK